MKDEANLSRETNEQMSHDDINSDIHARFQQVKQVAPPAQSILRSAEVQ